MDKSETLSDPLNEETGEVIKLLVEALSRVQWMAELGFWEEGGCSECAAHDEKEGHDEDCIVGIALKRAALISTRSTKSTDSQENQNRVSQPSDEEIAREAAKEIYRTWLGEEYEEGLVNEIIPIILSALRQARQKRGKDLEKKDLE
jgi:hypothetical protein